MPSLRSASEPGVQLEAGSQRQPSLGHRSIGADDEGERLDEPWGDARQRAPLANRFARPAETHRLERAQSAVRGLLVIEGDAAAEVVRLDERGAQSAAGGLVGDRQPVDAAADHEEIEYGPDSSRLTSRGCMEELLLYSKDLVPSSGSSSTADVRYVLEPPYSRSRDHHASGRDAGILQRSGSVPLRKAAPPAAPRRLRRLARQAGAGSRLRRRYRPGAVCARRRDRHRRRPRRLGHRAGAQELRAAGARRANSAKRTASICPSKTTASTSSTPTASSSTRRMENG